MNVFDIIGPIMIGPSSSHTAGAIKLGQIARILLSEEPIDAEIGLHGSFAATYKGHGTDSAIIGGLLGIAVDSIEIKRSFKIAEEKGLSFRFKIVEIKDAHPNTAIMILTGKSGKQLSVIGSSIGGGNISVKKIDNIDVDFSGQYNTLVIKHLDVPGAIADVANLLASFDINIAQMKVYRSAKGGLAIMIIETDQSIGCDLVLLLRKLKRTIDVVKIDQL